MPRAPRQWRVVLGNNVVLFMALTRSLNGMIGFLRTTVWVAKTIPDFPVGVGRTPREAVFSHVEALLRIGIHVTEFRKPGQFTTKELLERAALKRYKARP